MVSLCALLRLERLIISSIKMDIPLLAILITFVIGLAIFIAVDWHVSHSRVNNTIRTKSYKFGYFIGILHLSFGVLWSMIVLSDFELEPLEIGISVETFFPLAVSIGLLIVGFGVLYKWKIALNIVPISTLYVSYGIVQKAGGSSLLSSSEDMIPLTLILLLNAYCFYYAFYVQKSIEHE